MDKRYEKIINFLGKERVLLNEPLANHTTFKIGGPADLFYVAKTEEELVGAIGVVREVGVPYFILGGGSNVLAGDKGFKGMVIKCKMLNVKCKMFKEKALIIVGAGVPLSVVVDESLNNSLTGLEFAAGIPGTVGGAVRGNAGAWRKSIGDIVSRVRIITEDGQIKWLEKKECDFDYRTSRFKKSEEIIVEVELEMNKGDKQKIKEQVRENLEKRSSQPKESSAGCIFVNPKPSSAGELIERCGLKGVKIRQAQISEKHANFIINFGGAKAEDVVTLIDLIKNKVKEKFNLDLKEEIVRIGEF